MKQVLIAILFAVLMAPLTAAEARPPDWGSNPFRIVYRTPFETPPFNLIREEHFLPAFERGMKLQKKEIDLITGSGTPPTFQNTIEKLDNSGNLLVKVNDVFINLLSANTNEQLQEIAKQVAPLLAKHNDDILLNERLFARIRKLYDERGQLTLTSEQLTLLEKKYKDFVRGGALLETKQKEGLRQINEELSVLTLKFSDNVLKETNDFKLVIDRKEDLAGLPAAVVDTAAAAAQKAGRDGKWVFTLHNPSVMPFLQYAENRELRHKIWLAYANRGSNGNESDNKKIAARIASLRALRANLLGYKTHADYVLEENMAKNPAGVCRLLNQLWPPALERARSEARLLQEMIRQEGKDFPLAPWDWRFYAEKVKKAKYDLDDEMLRPYFSLDRVREGAFYVANRLYGITFKERRDIPLYHPDVKTFEVLDAAGGHVGILYLDYFPRPAKRGGAWMDNYRAQYVFMGRRITPIVVNCGNFTLPTKDQPSLLTFEEVTALFHEFGHGLHGLLSNCTYRSLSGTRVPRDFVELCSQIMENWAAEPEVLKVYARHYKTNEPIPDELVARIKKASLFNQGFATVEYLAASFLDMDWHSLADAAERNTEKFETEALNRIGLIPEIISRYRSTYFNHIFGGEYAAGYYSYIWSEVLDADAFEAFRKKGIFDPATAKSFLDNILSRGGSEEPMTLYKRFRGKEPSVEPLLKRRGLAAGGN